MTPDQVVLLVDDDQNVLSAHETVLRSAGVGSLRSLSDGREVLDTLEEGPVDLVLLDLKMPHVSGEDLLEEIRREHPDVLVIVVTGLQDVATAVRCMKLGAFDYMVKAVEPSRLVGGVRSALEIQALRRENIRLKEAVSRGQLRHPDAFRRIITRNAAMIRLFLLAETVARTREPVLIVGETGTGKELLARAIHDCSGVEGEYVIVNVAGFDDTMFSDALFGHKAGAYTGAAGARKGLVSTARDGTLVLDEIADLSPASQVKLLRLVENREYLPLGSDVVRRSDARLVLSTSRDLPQMITDGTFRKDLYYRLSTHQLSIPPLRERREDVRLLFDQFLAVAAGELGLRRPSPPENAIDLLQSYEFPGNVRELRTIAFHVASHCDDPSSGDRFPLAALAEILGVPQAPARQCPTRGNALEFPEELPTIREAVSALIDEAMHRAGGVQATAARYLGISPQALSRRLRSRGET